MNVFKRVVFALKHDIADGFVFLPVGNENLSPCRLESYEKASYHADRAVVSYPKNTRPEILVNIKSKRGL